MRTACTCALLSLLTTGCSHVSIATEIARAMREAPGKDAAITWYLDGELVRGAVPVAAAKIPAAARRTADEIVQPGGRVLFEGREWGPGYHGYRFVKAYLDGGTRTVTVDATGLVLSRSHSLELDDCPAPARSAAADLGKTVLTAQALQQGDEEQTFQFRLKDDAGQLWYAITTADGSILEHGRVHLGGA